MGKERDLNLVSNNRNAEKGDFIIVVPPMGTNFATYEGVVTDDIGDAAAPAPANKATEAALDAVLKLG